MDVAQAIGNVTQAWASVAAITTGIKTIVSIAADASDATDDAAERATAQQLISQFEKHAGEVEGTFNGDFGATMKSQSEDKFDEVGRFCTLKDFPKARWALRAYGVPMDATVTGTMGLFLAQLRAKFEESKR